MSDPKLISPLLDNFAMGGPFSEHHGICCCPAIDEKTGTRYIVKILSVPTSKVQLDALLLTGAYRSIDDALHYYQEVTEEITAEADILKKLSAMEGFLPFEGMQTVSKEDGAGFDVYLLSPYRQSLERHFRKYPMTHLAAVNLGLDMCAALAVCRQAGYLYTDLKPGNIFISDDQEYRIGDLGFVPLSGLAYASIPDKYRSSYTAPEITDPFSRLNKTLDIYAAGMVLYQAYNGGTLPMEGQAPKDAPLEPPMYADYEMAEIIMKAIDPNPENRWQDPIVMGQALVAYMQRNEINNTYIVPPVVLSEEDVIKPIEEEPSDNAAEQTPDSDQVVIAECFPEEDPQDEPPLKIPFEDAENASEDDLISLSFLDDLDSDDTTPGDEAIDGIFYDELSNDVSGILEQVDDLIAHETPEGVVPPEPIDVPVPELVITTDDEPEVEESVNVDEQATQVVSVPVVPTEISEEVEDEDEEEFEDYPRENRQTGRKILTVLLILLLLIGISICGYTLYKEYYLQPVAELRLVGSEDTLDVYVDADADESRLTVVCTDVHGTAQTAPVKNGVAHFNGLNPNTLYTVTIEVSGFGKLIGDLKENYTTPVQTNIAAFQAITGSEAGSVIFSFTMEGVDTETWNITYQTEGEPQITETFTGHMVSIQGLTVGKTYTFTLGSEDDLYIVGNNTLEYTAISPIMAQNLAISACSNESLTATWDAPEGNNVSQWSVRCYSENGYEQTLVTDKTSITFTGITCSDAHTVEVTAAGMSEASRCYMTSNAVTVTDISITQSDDSTITMSWNIGDVQPKGNWLILYSIDGSMQKEILRSNTTVATIRPVVPGASYEFSIQQEDSSTVFGGTASFDTAEAQTFSGYQVTAADIKVTMCKAPAATGWTSEDLLDEDYRIAFKSGESAGYVLKISKKFTASDDTITAMYVIRNTDGTPISWDSNQRTWRDMWVQNDCYLTVPALPAEAGNYTLDLYFNSQFVCNSSFTITE